MSPNHRDLITQVTYRQAAILAELPVNAPKLLLSFLTQLRQPEVPREPVGAAARDSAPTTCRSETVEWPEHPARARTPWRQEPLAHLHVASGPAHVEPQVPQTRTGSLCGSQVPEAAVTAEAESRSPRDRKSRSS